MILAILAVLASVAVPSLSKLLGSNQLQIAQNDFITALMHARESAVFSGKRTLFCPTRDGSSCANEARWERGWMLGHDANGDNQPDHGALYLGHSYAGKLNIQSSAGRRYVRFSPDGSAAGSNITLLFCIRDSEPGALSVVVSNSGRVRGAPATQAQAASCAQLR